MCGKATGYHLLASGFALGQVNGTGDSTTMKPAICVNSKGVSSEILQFGGSLDRLEKRK